MHRQQQHIGDLFQLIIGGARLHPLRRQVHVIDRAQDIIDVAQRQLHLTFGQPILDRGHFLGRQRAVAMRFDVAVLDVDHGDLFHVDPALTVLGVHAEHRCAVFADAKEVFRQIARHVCPQTNDAQNDWMRVQASRSRSSDVA